MECARAPANFIHSLSFGLGEGAPVAHPDPVFEPVRERLQELDDINCGGGESTGAETTRFVTLDVQLTAVLTANATRDQATESSGASLAPSL